MQLRRDQGPKSFGRRRPAAEMAAPGGGGSAAPVSLLAWSLRVSAIVGLVAVAGATQLARWNPPGGGPVRLAAGTMPAPADPETTGTIAPGGAAPAARGTRLDPCLAPVVSPAAEHLRP
jgi:hypothetical protein